MKETIFSTRTFDPLNFYHSLSQRLNLSDWRLFLLALLIWLPFALQGDKPLIIVTLPPHRTLVERIGGDFVDVQELIPKGADIHTFDPPFRSIATLSRAMLFFRAGLPFEERIVKFLGSIGKGAIFVNLSAVVELIQESHGCCHRDYDIHYWLSVRELQKQAHVVAEKLSERFPQEKETFFKRLKIVVEELQEMDRSLTKRFAAYEGREVLVVHPAYGYLARDYHFVQLSLEQHGKEIGAKPLLQLFDRVKAANISTLFMEKGYHSRAAERVAQGLNLRVVTLAPHDPLYLKTIQEIADSFIASWEKS